MLSYYKNRFPGLPEAIGTISKPFWVISEKHLFLTFVDHFWDQIRPCWTNIGPIVDQLLDQKSDHLGTRHAGD